MLIIEAAYYVWRIWHLMQRCDFYFANRISTTTSVKF